MSVPQEYFVFKINIFKKLFLITAAVSLITFFLGGKGFALGFLVGGAISAAIFSLLYKYVLIMRGIKLPGRKRFIAGRALVIYAIMAAALLIGLKKGIPVFLGTAAGIFSLKVAIFAQVFGEKYASPRTH